MNKKSNSSQLFYVSIILFLLLMAFGLFTIDYSKAPTIYYLEILAFMVISSIVIFSFMKGIKATHINIVLVIVFLYVLDIWLYRGGWRVGAVYYLAFLLAVIFLVGKSYREYLLISLLIIQILLVLAEFRFPELFVAKIESDFSKDIIFVTLSVVLLVLSIFKNLESNYEHARQYSQSLQRIHELNHFRGSVPDMFRSYLKACEDIFDLEFGFIATYNIANKLTIKEVNKGMNMIQPGMILQEKTFFLPYLQNAKSYMYNYDINEGSKQLFGQNIFSLLAANIYIGDSKYALITFYSTQKKEKELSKYECDLVELISINIGQFLNLKSEENENKRINTVLAQNELLFRSVFEKSQIGIALVNFEGKIVLANPKLTQLSGSSERELINTHVSEHIIDIEDSQRNIDKIMNREIDFFVANHHGVTKAGKQLNFMIAISLILNEELNESLLLCLIEDVTDAILKEAEITQLNDQLELQIDKMNRAYRELESFSYSVSHDLRAPLRIINSFAKIMEDEYGSKLDQEGNRLLKIIARNGEKMGQLIDDLLEFSRLNQSQKKFEEFSLKSLIIEVVNGNKAYFEGVNFDFHIGDFEKVWADRSLMRQAFRNLISNAMKFSANHDSPTINIFQDKSDFENLHIVIKDNGVGFDMKYYHKLFGVFQRLHSESEFPGTGVGLAIVQRIIERHQGKVWAESELNKGATFHITIPKYPN